MKDSREKENLKEFSWKVLENLLALALNYRKETVVEDQNMVITHWVKEECNATILVLAALVGWTVVEEKQLELVSAVGKEYK